MKTKLPQEWLDALQVIDIAFQPILNIHTGKIYAVEALLRNFQDVGFRSIFALFDKVYQDGLLYSFDIALREKAFIKFTTLKNYENIKLFFNLDNRLLEMSNFSSGNTSKILKRLGIQKENICFEISERHEIPGECNLEKILKHYRDENFFIAIDDFGVGYSGYKLLYDFTPDIIKIDRFFLQGIEKNLKKKCLVRNIVHLSIQLGIKVIAEGVETEAELRTCRDVGCHLVQGYFIQKPTKDIDEIQQEYKHISANDKNRRGKESSSYLKKYIETVTPIKLNTKMPQVLEYFKENKNKPIVPIINTNLEPVGILNELQIKDFLYSPYGMSLLLNDNANKSKLKNIISPCGYTDLNSSISTIIELFSNDTESIGIIITKDSKYYGFLSAHSIISIVNEENLLLARDQNPLTKLPGNRMIEKYMNEDIDANNSYVLTYFDLDNFKAFNDVYGFRNGDRVIQLFADILRKHLPSNFFKAHIGGDDFFLSIKTENTDAVMKYIIAIIKKFSDDARELYSQEDKRNGYILSCNRESDRKKFPLLSVSAAMIVIKKTSNKRSIEGINKILALEKKVAKNEPEHIAISSLL